LFLIEGLKVGELTLSVELLIGIQRDLALMTLLIYCPIPLSVLASSPSFFWRQKWLSSILDLGKLCVDAIRFLQLDANFLRAPKTVCAVQNVRPGLRGIFCPQTFSRRFDTANGERCCTYRALETAACTSERWYELRSVIVWGRHIPVALALHAAAWNLKQAARTIPAYYLVQHAPRTADLVTVLAIQKMFEGI
jgi:hypothetical protein